VRSAGVWSQKQKLTASDAAPGDEFGYSVAVSGYAVVVGAFGDNDAGIWSGSAYVYKPEPGVTPDVPTLSFPMLALLAVALAGLGWFLSQRT
jgi:hypothetical protein